MDSSYSENIDYLPFMAFYIACAALGLWRGLRFRDIPLFGHWRGAPMACYHHSIGICTGGPRPEFRLFDHHASQ